MKSNKPLLIVLVLALVCAGAFVAAEMQKKKNPAGDTAMPAEQTAATETSAETPPADEPYVAPVLPETLAYQGNPVNALCFAAKDVASGVKNEIDLANCVDEGISATDAADFKLESGFIGTAYKHDDAKEGEYPYTAYIKYKYLGQYKDKAAVFVEQADGKSSVFTAIHLLDRPEDGKLAIAERVFGGGDRCNTGLTDVRVENGSIAYAFNVTPFNFFIFGGHNPDNLQPFINLASGPTDCYGKATVQNNMLTNVELKEGMASLLAAKTALPEGLAMGNMQKCFDERLSEKVTAGTVNFNLEALNAFAKDFVEKCPKPAMPAPAGLDGLPGALPAPDAATDPEAPAAEEPAVPAAEETVPAEETAAPAEETVPAEEAAPAEETTAPAP